jgi:hypothetical protein
MRKTLLTQQDAPSVAIGIRLTIGNHRLGIDNPECLAAWTRRAKMKTTLAVLFLPLFLMGCASPSGQVSRQIDDTTISVTVRPLDQTRYEMIAVIKRIEDSWNLRGSREGLDQFSFPNMVATLDGEPAEFVYYGETPDVGPRARLKVSREGDKIIAEYRVGYADGKQSSFTAGRVEVLPK